MQQYQQTMDPSVPVMHLGEETRAEFISRTYMHLAGAILAFVGIEMYLFSSGLAEVITTKLVGANWLLVLGAFMMVSWLASRTAHTVESLPMQYLMLGIYILAWAVIFAPMLFIAQSIAPGVIESAAGVTLVGFAGLTAVAFFTRKDFSFLRSMLMWGGFAALGAIVASVIFGWHLGTWFSVGMIAFAGAAILYDTSNVLHHFPKDRYVGAALELFGSIALLFWYVLRFFMASED
ncbi:MAG: Bax inhibitor-1 family protein [Pseudomonadota bacterium]